MSKKKKKKSLTQLWFPRNYWKIAAWDSQQNRRLVKADQRFLIVRHPGHKPFFYFVLLDWLEKRFPDIRSLFEWHLLPCYIRDWSRYRLCLPWLQDPVQNWSPLAYWRTNQINVQCDRKGIPIINRVDRLANAAKFTGVQLMSSVGIRTPRMALITNKNEFYDTHLGLNLPLFVRENWGHGGLMFRADTAAQVRQIPLKRFSRPVAVEFVDVKNPRDGLCRKYRYVVAGDIGVPKGLVISKEWMVKWNNAVDTEATREEETAYLKSIDPNHQQLVAARKVLGLDFVAFDYSYDCEGRMVVWEANPYPRIRFSKGRMKHVQPAVRRTLAAMVKLYFERAGMKSPEAMEDVLRSFEPEWP